MDFFTILWSFYVRNDIQDAELEVRKAEKKNQKYTEHKSAGKHRQAARPPNASLSHREKCRINYYYYYEQYFWANNGSDMGGWPPRSTGVI